MQIVQAPRASAILYNLLAQHADSRPWLLPANICPIVPITFLKAHIPFQLVDISAATLNMDLEQAAEGIKSRKFGGLLYAHTYGEPSTPQGFFTDLKNLCPELVIVDDRCLCIPDLDPVSVADVILFSTGYAKIVEFNFGGYAFIDDRLKYQPVYLPFNASHHDEIEKQHKEAVLNRAEFVYQDSDWLESNSPLPAWHDYSAQIETSRKTSLAQRSILNNIYENSLPRELQLPGRYQTWRFNIRVKHKAKVLSAIFAAGLFASSHYASMAGIMADGFTPQADALSNEVINLFNDGHFDEHKAQKTCEVILGNI